MNLYLIIFIVAILSYFYLLYEINKNNYTIVFIYFIFLIIGYYFIGLKIYLYNLFILLYNLLKYNYFLEGNTGLDEKPETNILKDKKNLKKAGKSLGEDAKKTAEKIADENDIECSDDEATEESVLAESEYCLTT
jgi:hypothetical protein